MSTAIEFNHVSKQYRLGLVSTKTLSHDLDRWFQTTILHREDPYLKIGDVNDRATHGNSDYVWALKDIDFKVEQGDVVGIIGKNGAGKSTLLKLLSRVTAPTMGSIRARGRIASLLEIGTGFHSEMTGRENIYMNGAILGMTKQEISSKLDEIVDFSGCERYLDTPVKRYSSGMMVRLGFAVAAHLDPEILVVDEVLAVGDAEFQKKAIGKMQAVSHSEGRTVLFVSHNMASIRQLCTTGVLLDKGKVQLLGSVSDVVESYLYQADGIISINLEDRKDHVGSKKILIVGASVESNDGRRLSAVRTGDSFRIHLKLKNNGWTKEDSIQEFSICLKDELENRIVVMNDDFVGQRIQFDPSKSEYNVYFEVERLSLNCGRYFMSLYIQDQHDLVDSIQRALILDVEAGCYYEGITSLTTGVGSVFQNYKLHY